VLEQILDQFHSWLEYKKVGGVFVEFDSYIWYNGNWWL